MRPRALDSVWLGFTKHKRGILLTLFLAGVLGGCGKGPPPRTEAPEITLRAEPLHFLPGEVVTVALKATHPGDAVVEPEVTDDMLGGLTIIEGPVREETKLSGGWKQTVFIWRLTGYMPGPVTIGPIPVTLGGKKGHASASIALTIDDPLGGRTAELSELRGEKAPLDIPYAALMRLVIWITAGVVIFVGIVVLLVIWLVKRRQPDEAARALPTPAETALAALAALRETLPTVTDFRPLYYDMNLVLRRFIEKEFGFAASRETTEEFLEDARHGLPEELCEGLDDYFEACDLVKYAGMPVDRSAAALALDTAVAFVRKADARPKRMHRIQEAACGIA